MNALHRDFDAQTSELFEQFADACVVTRGADPAVTTRCVAEDGVEVVGEYGRVVGRATRVSFIKTEWDPKRGDLVSLDDTVRAVESLDSDDGLVVQVVLHG